MSPLTLVDDRPPVMKTYWNNFGKTILFVLIFIMVARCRISPVQIKKIRYSNPTRLAINCIFRHDVQFVDVGQRQIRQWSLPVVAAMSRRWQWARPTGALIRTSNETPGYCMWTCPHSTSNFLEFWGLDFSRWGIFQNIRAVQFLFILCCVCVNSIYKDCVIVYFIHQLTVAYATSRGVHHLDSHDATFPLSFPLPAPLPLSLLTLIGYWYSKLSHPVFNSAVFSAFGK